MTQQNAALVEESTASARSLTDQSARLQEIIAFFKLNEGGTPRSAASSSPAARMEELV
jgi:hypothetical protein